MQLSGVQAGGVSPQTISCLLCSLEKNTRVNEFSDPTEHVTGPSFSPLQGGPTCHLIHTTSAPILAH